MHTITSTATLSLSLTDDDGSMTDYDLFVFTDDGIQTKYLAHSVVTVSSPELETAQIFVDHADRSVRQSLGPGRRKCSLFTVSGTFTDIHLFLMSFTGHR